jgi:hypothetical protein
MTDKTGNRKPETGNRKGHAFTIDALLGTILFILLLSTILSYAGPSRESSWNIPQERMAQDALVLLDKAGTLDSQNASLIDSQLAQMLGNWTKYRLELFTYDYSGAAFVLISNSSIGQALPSESTIFETERSFFVTNNSTVSNYTIARLYRWK